MTARRELLTWLGVVALYAGLVGYLTVRDFGATAYDDSYFFKRFAVNALDHGMFAWNTEDGPIYGSTSQLFQVVATGVAAITRTHFVVAIRVFNAVALVGLGAVLFRWCGRASADPLRAQAVALLGLGGPLVLTTVLTGMETALTLALLAVVLGHLFRPDAPPTAAWKAALLTAVVYLCRPDAALLPAAAVCLESLARRRLPLRYALWLAGFIGLTWLVLWAYYGTALPLSFYMKTLPLGNYGDHVVGLGWHSKQLHGSAALVFAAPLLWVAGRSPAIRSRGATPALLIAAVLFGSYHLFLTNEIMGYRGRFYVPAIVPVVMVAARCWDGFVQARRWPTFAMLVASALAVGWAYDAGAIPNDTDFFLSRISWPAYAGVAFAAAVLLLIPPRVPAVFVLGAVYAGLFAGLIGWKPPGETFAPSDAQVMRRHASEVTTARGVFDVARCLPNARTVYHSEMGVTGLVLSKTRLVDLAGILSRGPGIDDEPFETYCDRDQPEAIFLPHRNYRQLNAEIRASTCFENYRRVIGHSSSPLHIRRDLVDGFMKCATTPHRWPVRARDR